MRFYLGLHQPADAEKINMPVFLSVARLLNRKKPLQHPCWIMDSGGFTMIAKHGMYTIGEDDYIDCINRHNANMAFCQDWMCEPFMLSKTGLTVKDHQRLTLCSYVSMASKCDKTRPVLQGWLLDDYKRHIDAHEKAGVDMKQLFGVGTVCSRNSDPNVIYNIISGIKEHYPGIQLHGFGVKSDALVAVKNLLTSADSMAWSSRGRRMKMCPDCGLNSCGNCLEFALLWRKKILYSINKKTVSKYKPAMLF